jgi:hypothetical protein
MRGRFGPRTVIVIASIATAMLVSLYWLIPADYLFVRFGVALIAIAARTNSLVAVARRPPTRWRHASIETKIAVHLNVS